MSDISRLFQEDPLKLTQDDITAIVNRYREARAQFNLGDKTAGKTAKVKGEKPKVEKLKTVDLDDLLN